MNWQHSESTVRPAKADDTLSKKYVYIRKNITEVERTGMDGNVITFYEYDETTIPKEDFYEISACIADTQEQSQTNAIETAEIRGAAMETSEATETNSADISELRGAIMELAEQLEEV